MLVEATAGPPPTPLSTETRVGGLRAVPLGKSSFLPGTAGLSDRIGGGVLAAFEDTRTVGDATLVPFAPGLPSAAFAAGLPWPAVSPGLSGCAGAGAAAAGSARFPWFGGGCCCLPSSRVAGSVLWTRFDGLTAPVRSVARFSFSLSLDKDSSPASLAGAAAGLSSSLKMFRRLAASMVGSPAAAAASTSSSGRQVRLSCFARLGFSTIPGISCCIRALHGPISWARAGCRSRSWTCGRFSGSFRIMLRISLTHSLEYSDGRGPGRAFRIFWMSPPKLKALNGVFCAESSCMMTPSDHTSALTPYPLFDTSSGHM